MNNWIGTVGGLVGIIVFLGATVVYLRGSKDKGTITTLEASNKALVERVSLLEASEKRLADRVGALERENASLLSQRPSAEVLAEIHTDLAQHDADTKAGFARLEGKT